MTSLPTGARSPTGDDHPGIVEFEDRVDERTWTEPAEAVPQTIAWAEGPDGWVPVARVVSDGAAGRLEITRFGIDGGFLDVTVQAPPRSETRTEPTPVPEPVEQPHDR